MVTIALASLSLTNGFEKRPKPAAWRTFQSYSFLYTTYRWKGRFSSIQKWTWWDASLFACLSTLRSSERYQLHQDSNWRLRGKSLWNVGYPIADSHSCFVSFVWDGRFAVIILNYKQMGLISEMPTINAYVLAYRSRAAGAFALTFSAIISYISIGMLLRAAKCKTASSKCFLLSSCLER